MRGQRPLLAPSYVYVSRINSAVDTVLEAYGAARAAAAFGPLAAPVPPTPQDLDLTAECGGRASLLDPARAVR